MFVLETFLSVCTREPIIEGVSVKNTQTWCVVKATPWSTAVKDTSPGPQELLGRCLRRSLS